MDKLLPDPLWKRLSDLETPFFLFNLDELGKRVKIIRSALEPVGLYYVVKCNSHPAILKTFHDLSCGFEANNRAELKKVHATGARADQVINSSPITPAADVAYMFAAGVNRFACDSLDQIDNLHYNAPGSKVYIRLFTTNSGSRLDLSKRLGISPEDAPKLIDYAKARGLKPYGVTFHVGSQCRNPDNWRVGIREAAGLFNRFPEMTMLDIGGGFPIPYHMDIPEISDIFEVIQEAIRTCFRSRPDLVVEPGRFLVGTSGLLVTSVVQSETKDPISRAVVDASVFTGLIEKLEFKNGFQYPLQVNHNGGSRRYTILGPTCDGEDIIASDVDLPFLKVDHQRPRNSSRIFIKNTGAYTFDYSPIRHGDAFNGAKVPEVYLRKGEVIEKASEY